MFREHPPGTHFAYVHVLTKEIQEMTVSIGGGDDKYLQK
jgi:hypothetical protein